MTLKNSSHKQFKAMFCQSMKPASIMAILAFICFLFFTLTNPDIYNLTYRINTAFFFDELRKGGFGSFASLAFIGAGVVNAMLLFNFAWSKKHSNVIFSLGMKRSDIYFSKVLGGLVPMAGAIFLAGCIETIACVSSGYTVDSRFFAMAALVMLNFFTVYALSFLISSAVMSNVGNVVEGIIFTGLIFIFTMALEAFLINAFWEFTHGAYIPAHYEINDVQWNWADPLIAEFREDEEMYRFMDSYFKKHADILPSAVHFSGVISGTVYSVIALTLGFIGFRKRRNEICGTWGRARVMNEIIAAVAGFYAVLLVSFGFASQTHGDGSLITFLSGCAAFIVVYIIFKLIFGYKRKKEIKASFNRFPAYAMGFGAICIIFSLGLFGYSSKLPDASEIKSVSVSSPSYKFMDDAFSGSSHFALKEQNIRNHYIVSPDLDGTVYNAYDRFPVIVFNSKDDINKVLNIHNGFIEDGRIKNNGAHSCATNVVITYTLKNGKTITRYYTETTEGTAQKLLTLSDTDVVNSMLSLYMHSDVNFDKYRHQLLYGEEAVYDGEYYEGLEEDLLSDDYIYNETFKAGTYYFDEKSSYLFTESCYLFPKDMSGGYKLGVIDNEFYKAILTDMKKLSSQQVFNHSPEDEIGVISFGLSNSAFMGWISDGSGVIYAEEDKDVEENYAPNGTVQTTSWNINSSDIKAIVLTKDMTNTIAYLEEHDLMKHFESKLDASDVKAVRLATMGELYGENKKSHNFPIFYAAYWTGVQMEEWLNPKNSLHLNYLFDNIHNEITDKKQIDKLLASSLLYGTCTNDCKIMEITYKDGAVATVMIPAGAEALK